MENLRGRNFFNIPISLGYLIFFSLINFPDIEKLAFLLRSINQMTPEKVLKEVFGYESFRHHQKDIINSVLKEMIVLC